MDVLVNGSSLEVHQGLGSEGICMLAHLNAPTSSAFPKLRGLPAACLDTAERGKEKLLLWSPSSEFFPCLASVEAF